MADQVQKKAVDQLFQMAWKYAKEKGVSVLPGESVQIPEHCRVDECGCRLTRPAAKKRFNRLVRLILDGKLRAA
jgi:hypothetical protein